VQSITIVNFNSRGDLLVDSLLKVFKAANLPEPQVLSDGFGMIKGLRVTAKAKEIGDTTKTLFETLGYHVPPVTEDRATSQSRLDIFIGTKH